LAGGNALAGVRDTVVTAFVGTSALNVTVATAISTEFTAAVVRRSSDVVVTPDGSVAALVNVAVTPAGAPASVSCGVTPLIAGADKITVAGGSGVV
jgi:hypothetical protein